MLNLGNRMAHQGVDRRILEVQFAFGMKEVKVSLGSSRDLDTAAYYSSQLVA